MIDEEKLDEIKTNIGLQYETINKIASAVADTEKILMSQKNPDPAILEMLIVIQASVLAHKGLINLIDNMLE